MLKQGRREEREMERLVILLAVGAMMVETVTKQSLNKKKCNLYTEIYKTIFVKKGF